MLAFLTFILSAQTGKLARPRLEFVPLPAHVTEARGDLVTRNPTIVAISPAALPLAQVLADEIELKTGIRPIVQAKPKSGSIILRIAGSGPAESYKIVVNNSVTLTAPTLQGLDWGTVTLLQAVRPYGPPLDIPHMTVTDQPARPYRGLMIDVARKYHSIPVLKQCVELCRMYKVRYMQLHLTDDQSFMFPSEAFPEFATSNQNGGPSYTLDELKDLVHFADVRGVTIIPEMDIPGHSATLIRTMPQIFKITGTKPYEHHATINFVGSDALKAVGILVEEMCSVFHSSPYFHMGGDEADISLADQNADFQAAFKKYGLPDHSQQELFRHFLGQVDEMVKKNGKKLIVWEGFGRNPASKFLIPKDVLVMEFENAYYLPGDLLADGYDVVNASWTPLYLLNRHVWPAEKIYNWNVGEFGRFSNLFPTAERFHVADTSHIEGAQICSWESPEEIELENLRRIVPAMAERLWNPNAGTYSQFEQRLQAQDRLFDRLVHPVQLTYSKLDAVDPNGYDVHCFEQPVTVTLSSSPLATTRFTLDGKPPTGNSPPYHQPFEITRTTTVRAALFDRAGHRLGYETSVPFYYVPHHEKNLAVGKKVTVSGGTQGGQVPELAVDDNLDLASSWWAAPGPQWLQVDLAAPYSVDRIVVFPYWDGRRYYQYTVDVSEDGKTWDQVADRSTNTSPASEQGDEINFPPRQVRYVKVNMLRGSANEGVHLVELQVWPAKR